MLYVVAETGKAAQNMLTSTFQHLRGIGAKKERHLWRAGVHTWDDLVSRTPVQMSLFGDLGVPGSVGESRLALAAENAEFFAQKLPRREHYRIALGFPANTLFLDIETTGLSVNRDALTLVGWSMGSKYEVYIRGRCEEPLKNALAVAKAIVTFNGSGFDLPFMRRVFPDLPIPAAHIDLRFLTRRLGLKGGQKAIEQELGLNRPEHLRGISGRAAPRLWQGYEQGDPEALELLISYNRADVEGMKHIFDAVIRGLVEKDELPAWESGFSRSAASRRQAGTQAGGGA